MGTAARIAGLVFGLMLVSLGFATAANAGSYRVEACKYNAGSDVRLVTNPWNLSTTFVNKCLTPSEAKLHAGSGWTYGDTASVKWEVEHGMSILGGRFYYYKASTPNLIASYWVNNKDGSGAVRLDNLDSHQPGAYVLRNEWDQMTGGAGKQVLRATLKCEAATCPVTPGLPYVSIGDVELDVGDFVAPTVYAPTGTMFGSGSVSGTRSVEGLGLDAQSGVHKIALMVNLVPISTRTQSCAVLTKLRPCAAAALETFNVSTASYPFVEGTNYVSICVSDYAEASSPNTTCETRTTVVDN